MMAVWILLGEAFYSFQTPKHSRFHDTASLSYWLTQTMLFVHMSSWSIPQHEEFAVFHVGLLSLKLGEELLVRFGVLRIYISNKKG